jgi:hypothetical protein
MEKVTNGVWEFGAQHLPKSVWILILAWLISCWLTPSLVAFLVSRLWPVGDDRDEVLGEWRSVAHRELPFWFFNLAIAGLMERVASGRRQLSTALAVARAQPPTTPTAIDEKEQGHRADELLMVVYMILGGWVTVLASPDRAAVLLLAAITISILLSMLLARLWVWASTLRARRAQLVGRLLESLRESR